MDYSKKKEKEGISCNSYQSNPASIVPLVSLSVSIGIHVNCLHWQTLHKQDWCIECEQEAANISVRFMLHSRQIRFTVNTVGAAKWDAGSLVAATVTGMPPNSRNDIPTSLSPSLPELSRTFWSTSPLLLCSSWPIRCFPPIDFPAHWHLCCVCHFPVSQPDRADHSGMSLITSASSTSEIWLQRPSAVNKRDYPQFRKMHLS